jgi:hypothetical protein
MRSDTENMALHYGTSEYQKDEKKNNILIITICRIHQLLKTSLFRDDRRKWKREKKVHRNAASN